MHAKSTIPLAAIRLLKEPSPLLVPAILERMEWRVEQAASKVKQQQPLDDDTAADARRKLLPEACLWWACDAEKKGSQRQ